SDFTSATCAAARFVSKSAACARAEPASTKTTSATLAAILLMTRPLLPISPASPACRARADEHTRATPSGCRVKQAKEETRGTAEARRVTRRNAEEEVRTCGLRVPADLHPGGPNLFLRAPPRPPPRLRVELRPSPGKTRQGRGPAGRISSLCL